MGGERKVPPYIEKYWGFDTPELSTASCTENNFLYFIPFAQKEAGKIREDDGIKMCILGEEDKEKQQAPLLLFL